ncbi:hypothetical protein SPHINGOT1_340075 [Sphingomonas sp. T1]|nr:hypothetical protein SPHINGOT1_340075 [Sphingomonas sp. T1]
MQPLYRSDYTSDPHRRLAARQLDQVDNC